MTQAQALPASPPLLDLKALRDCWHARERLVLLQTGFGLGDAFLGAWKAWRDDAARCDRLHFIAIEPDAPDAMSLSDSHRGSELAALAQELAAQWPPRTRNLHRLGFEGGRVQLLLALGEPTQWLVQIAAQVDVFLIGNFDAGANPSGWAKRTFKALARLAAPGARLLSTLPQDGVRHALSIAGFKLDATVYGEPTHGITLARYEPGFKPRGWPRTVHVQRERHALIVGAGLAGCASAWALAEQGWTSTLIERHAAPTQEASGNVAGLLHGIVNPQDGAHARFNRAAALEAQRAVRQAIQQHGVKGSLQGLLRLEMSTHDVAAMQAQLQRLQLPADYVQAVGAERASALCGLPLARPAWFYPGAGWVDPGGLARSFLERAAPMTRLHACAEVHALRPAQGRWQLLDAAGRLIGESPTLILANAADAMRLLGMAHWPLESVRGQLSLYRNRDAAPGQRLRLPRIPITGAGYLLPEIDGLALFGASAQPGDTEPAVRNADQAQNLARLQRLSAQPASLHADMLHGRVGWRCTADDRLPLVGAVPDEVAAVAAHSERADRVPRLPGLFVITALGSRGISWAALGAQILASTISGAPVPLERRLLDALDPARFLLRTQRRVGATASPRQ
jgi:tRNA 5-methylaminomethyl-2-thiouridine biosynthesis bifunctional protein